MENWIDAKLRLPEPYATVEIRLSSGQEIWGYRYPSGEWSHKDIVTHWR
ncbi:hypothetical protein [Pedobacter panaciterrae]